jgi:hypothetical protein
MIISIKHKFIFVHTRKSAGTSLKLSLFNFLGDKDVIIGSCQHISVSRLLASKLIQRELRSSSFSSNVSCLAKAIKHCSASYGVNELVKENYRFLHASYPQHASVVQLLQAFAKLLSENQFTIFAVHRLPHERLYSDYFFNGLHRRGVSLAQFVEDVARGELIIPYSNSFVQLSCDCMEAIDIIPFELCSTLLPRFLFDKFGLKIPALPRVMASNAPLIPDGFTELCQMRFADEYRAHSQWKAKALRYGE